MNQHVVQVHLRRANQITKTLRWLFTAFDFPDEMFIRDQIHGELRRMIRLQVCRVGSGGGVLTDLYHLESVWYLVSVHMAPWSETGTSGPSEMKLTMPKTRWMKSISEQHAFLSLPIPARAEKYENMIRLTAALQKMDDGRVGGPNTEEVDLLAFIATRWTLAMVAWLLPQDKTYSM